MGIWRRHINKDVQIDGMHAFYLNALLRSLVFSMIGIFTPIFIYTSLLSITGDMITSISAVALYYLITRFVVLVFNIPASKIIEKLGFRKSVIISAVLLSGYIGTLILAANNYLWFVVASVLIGLNIPLYWVSRNSVIALDSKKKSLGKEAGFVAIVERIAGVAGPIASGFMIERWGFPTMYAAAFVVLFVSVFPLLTMPHHVHRNGVSIKGYYIWLKSRRFFHQAIGSVGRAFDDYGYNIVWPLALLLMGIHYSNLGVFYSALTVITILVRYVSSSLFDKLYKKGGLEDESLFGIAAIGASVAWVVRLFVTHLWGAFILDGSTMIFGTTYRNISYDYDTLGGKRMHEIAYYTYKEMTYSIAVIVLCLLWIVGARYGVWKELIFLSSAFWILMGIVQGRESNLK